VDRLQYAQILCENLAMPLFFDFTAHVWIFYILFINGFLVVHLLRHMFSRFRNSVVPIESIVIASFGISLAMNGFVLLGVEYAEMALSDASKILFSSTIVLAVAWLKLGCFRQLKNIQLFLPSLCLYACAFVILFFNGGLIDQLSDAWWHMSMANKMAWNNTAFPESSHLLGFGGRYYPPLWHGNLALLRELSGEALPALWNTFTVWGAVLKLMAFYLFSFVLFKDRYIAFVAALLFFLLPGLGNSYMRVSAWPSHLSYVFMFYSWYLAFHIIDCVDRGESLKQQVVAVLTNWQTSLALLFCLGLMLLLHQLEVLFFVTAIALYFVALSITRALSSNLALAELPFAGLLRIIYWLCLSALILWSLYVGYDMYEPGMSYDHWLVTVIPTAVLAFLLILDFIGRQWRRVFMSVGVVLILILLLTIHGQHLASLFLPELVLERSGSHERPMLGSGLFNGQLDLPGWHLQLRSGLLWSGLVGLVLSLWCWFKKPSRGMLLLASNSVFVWLLVLNPYLFQWVTNVLDDYHSVWRFAMLSFHPAIIAFCLVSLFRFLIEPENNDAVGLNRSSGDDL
jgi:hypothetical protein